MGEEIGDKNERDMSILSVNVGEPLAWNWHGKVVWSAIDKRPVAGAILLRPDNFVGDRQADLTVHGGADKAAYVYPAAYYDAWRRELWEMTLPWGMFGENLTMAGVDDTTVYIGDRYQIGAAEVIVTQPRLPCYKLGMKFGRDTFVKQFLQSGRTGFYLAVTRAGTVPAGAAVRLLAREAHGVAVADVVRLYTRDRFDVEGLRRAVTADALPEWWREEFQRRLDRVAAERR